MKTVKKVWGYEFWIVNRLEYCGKFLFVDKDTISSYHCHNRKTETFYCLAGRVILTIEGKDYELISMGKIKTILPGQYHKFRGIVDSLLLEVSTHHDDKDVERKEPSVRL